MKTSKIVFGAIALSVFLIQCTSSKKTSSASSKPTSADVLAAAQKRFPDMTAARLTEGETIYNGPCVRCHAAQPIGKYNEERWEKIIAHMAPKAKLNPDQTETVRRYVLAQLDVAKK